MTYNVNLLVSSIEVLQFPDADFERGGSDVLEPSAGGVVFDAKLLVLCCQEDDGGGL